VNVNAQSGRRSSPTRKKCAVSQSANAKLFQCWRVYLYLAAFLGIQIKGARDVWSKLLWWPIPCFFVQLVKCLCSVIEFRGAATALRTNINVNP
jgi:hypothetical protein